MNDDIVAAITRAATEDGIDPALALSVADRESSGHHAWEDPRAHASKTIFGLFQMSGPERNQWGGNDPNSSDPYTQAKMWGAYINGQVKPNMQQYLGRAPTNEELYLGHYFGENRASRMIAGRINPNTDVRDVFTPQEMAGNPNFARAGTVGNLTNSITADMQNRQQRFAMNANAPAVNPEAYVTGGPVTPPPQTNPTGDYAKTQMALNAPSALAETGSPGSSALGPSGEALTSLAREAEQLEGQEQQQQQHEQQQAQQAAAAGESAFANARQAANYRAGAAAQRPISLPGNEVDISQFGIPTTAMQPGSGSLPNVIGQPQPQQVAQQ